MNASLPAQSLLLDQFLTNAPRIKVGERMTPSLGGIALLSKLGQGGMGAVYYGVHGDPAQEVAVKILPFHLAQAKPDAIKRFFREARIAQRIQSEFLVRVSEVAQENNLAYLVMEYVSGKSAKGVLEEARANGQAGLDERSAIEVCIAACKGLAAAHNAGVVHRDVKPDNILVPLTKASETYDYNNSKLADLGLARNDGGVHSLTGKDACLGTAGYAAPEQIMDMHKSGKPADVFGMGATLYALLCGEAPFKGDSGMMVMWATVDAPHIPITMRRGDVSKATSGVIETCLAKAPEHRYADGAALLVALENCSAALSRPLGVDSSAPQMARTAETPRPPHVGAARINRARSHAPKAAILKSLPNSVHPPIISPHHAPSRTRFWTAAIVLAAAAVGYYLVRETPSQALSRQEAIDELATRNATAEAKRALEDQRKKQEASQAIAAAAMRKEAEAAEQRKQFERLLAQSREALSRDQLKEAIQYFKQAQKSPGFELSPKRDELDALGYKIQECLTHGADALISMRAPMAPPRRATAIPRVLPPYLVKALKAKDPGPKSESIFAPTHHF